MSLRRSARVQTKPLSEEELPNGRVAEAVAAPTKKRGRKSKSTEAIASTAVALETAQDVEPSDCIAIPAPTTPNKRRKVAISPTKPVPFTPTPAAIGLMTSNSVLRPTYSTGDIDDATPPPPPQPAITRPTSPHHTNATLATPSGTHTYSNFEEPSTAPATTVPATTASSSTTTPSILSQACAHLTTIDPTLTSLITRHPCHVFSPSGLAETIDPFRSLTSGIIAQQVSGAAAKSIKNKFVSLFSPTTTTFPTPAQVAATPLPRLREAGLSQRKAEYISGLAQKFVTGDLTTEMLLRGTDEEVMANLTAVRGLGAWSVEMFMCFGLKRMDVFSTGDLGVQRGMAVYKGRDVRRAKGKGGGKWKYMSEREMEEVAEPFRPWRSLFMWYMWRVEDVDVDVVGGGGE